MSLLSRLAVQAARAYGILSSDKNRVIADYLVVAGGGGGGGDGGGGGGAGGLLTSIATLSTLNTYSIAVGAGASGGVGSANGGSGSNSAISGTGLSTITSTGGGGGGRGVSGSGLSGGSGGGGGMRNALSGGAGTSGQGNNGGTGSSGTTDGAAGGGGGSSAVGGSASSTKIAGNGGAGTASSISGSSVTYAGGGGGSTRNADLTYTNGTGGAGGGGNGGAQNSAGSAGTANRGGGGGGGDANATSNGGAGGSGIVIISYTATEPKFVGGTITTSGGKQIHTFTSSGTLSPITPITASYLVVAGGGGGGSSGGGGGAGGLLTSSTTLYSGATYIVTVGAGGNGGAANATTGTASSGSSSSLSGTGLTTLTATGGGGGGNYSVSGATGGSGGGAGRDSGSGGAGTSGQGFAGGATGVTGASGGAGGGGGSSAVGSAGVTNGTGNGGAGTSSSISGTSTTYAGGGGGGGYNSGTNGTGGSGGGGTGGTNAAQSGVNGTPNTGGGGGGAGGAGGGSVAGAAGGSGIVIISYAGSQAFNGGLVTSSGGNTIHTFTSTGALTPLTNNLNNSLRFRSSASAYLSRTPTVASNQKTWTWSAWVKRGDLASEQILFGAGNTYINLTTSNLIECNFRPAATSYYMTTTQVFRDPSAWYHIVVVYDSTQATAANRAKMYINGNQVSSFSVSSYTSIPQNQDATVNSATAHNIGRYTGTGNQFDGYLADVNFIDGQALEPYYFGNNDANGVWKPIQYKGTYGQNGFYLTFGNTTSTTTLGYDSSPNGNNWTTNGISLTAGNTYDAMTDVPTNTSATVANYCVMNPLQKGGSVSASDGNLTVVNTADSKILGSFGMSSGKWYWEATVNTTTDIVGIALGNSTLSSYTGGDANSWGYYFSNGNKYNNGSASAYGASCTTNDIVGVAFDADAGTLTFYKNNVSQGTAYSSLTSGPYFPCAGNGNANTVYMNFGQRPFNYSAPSGFLPLNTYNLPTPTILQGNKYMDATLWTGNGATSNVIVNAGQFKPDMVWGKTRNVSGVHRLFDSNRGVGKQIYPNLTDVEDTNDVNGYVSAFNSNGFSTTAGSLNNNNWNTNTNTYVAWQWQAGQGTTSSNTNGSITSTVSVNTTAGFSVVTYTGTGTANQTVGHGLGVAPAMVIIKGRGNAFGWATWHKSLGTAAGTYLALNTTAASATDTTMWQPANNSPTVISVSGSASASSWTNAATTYVAYCFAEISGYSKFGSYTGNGSTDGPFVYTGFRPKYVMVKRTDTTGDWQVIDTSRQLYNNGAVANQLRPNSSVEEASAGTYNIDILSNGFKDRTGASTNWNTNGGTYIYMAFAEHPAKISNAR